MPGHPADLPGPFVLVDDLEQPVLDDDEVHHLERVLRVRVGDPVVLGDGVGSWRPARYAPRPEPSGPVESVPAPTHPLAVGFALVKGSKPELVVQKLAELGIDRIVPFRAARSVVRWDDARATRSLERLRAVARTATQQCHRPWLPLVEAVTELSVVLAEPGVALADRAGEPLRRHQAMVLVGPEGGWAPEELEAAAARGVRRVAVGEHVLRAETAAVTAGAVLAGLRAGLVDPAATYPSVGIT